MNKQKKTITQCNNYCMTECTHVPWFCQCQYKYQYQACHHHHDHFDPSQQDDHHHLRHLNLSSISLRPESPLNERRISDILKFGWVLYLGRSLTNPSQPILSEAVGNLSLPSPNLIPLLPSSFSSPCLPRADLSVRRRWQYFLFSFPFPFSDNNLLNTNQHQIPPGLSRNHKVRIITKY